MNKKNAGLEFAKSCRKIIFIFLPFFLISCDKKISPQFQTSLGTVCFVNLYEDGKKSIYDEIAARISEIDGEFNVNKDDSEISNVNKNAKISPVKVSDDFAFVLKTALKAAEISDGDFNPALGKLIKLWGINTENAHVPKLQEIDEAKSHCGWKKIIFDEKNQTVFLDDEEMSLDFGAIAKGFSADEIAKICKEKNVRRAIIDLGGNVLAFGKKSKNEKWNVGIKNPDAPESEVSEVVSIEEGSVVTSGNYERYFIQDGKRYHHILDGKTGFPAESGLKSVTVICGKSIFADALSTAFFVAGKEKSLALKPLFEEKFGEKIEVVFIES